MRIMSAIEGACVTRPCHALLLYFNLLYIERLTGFRLPRHASRGCCFSLPNGPTFSPFTEGSGKAKGSKTYLGMA